MITWQEVDQELNTVTADLRAKQSSVRPEPVDEDTKVKLAVQTSRATLPGAFDCNQPVGPKPSQEQILEIMRMGERQKSRDHYVDHESRQPVPPSFHEEHHIDGLFERMSRFQIEETEKKENEHEVTRKRKKRKAILWGCVIMLAVLGVVAGVVVGGLRTRKTVDVPATATERASFKLCYYENTSERSVRFTQLQTALFASEAAVVRVGDTNLDRSTVRAALCWLADVDEMEIQLVERSEHEVVQRFALASMYYSFVGIATSQTHRLSTTNWLSGLHVCEWDAVGCDEDHDSVTSLDLNEMSLTGTIPKETLLLSDLEFLDLSFNGLVGEIPSRLALLAQLQHLKLDANELDGTIPSEFGNMSELQILDLGYNQLTGKIPSEMLLVPHLRRLTLESNALTGMMPASLSKASDLEYLSMSTNGLSGTIPDLSNLQNLVFLEIASNELSGQFPDMSGCSMLEHLVLREIDLSGAVPSYIWSFQKLRQLEIKHTALSGTIPTEVAALTALEWLHLSGSNSFSGTIPTQIGELTLLTSLAFARMSKARGHVPSELGRLTSLRLLSLPNGISGTIPAEVCSLSYEIDFSASLEGPCPPCDCCTSCT